MTAPVPRKRRGCLYWLRLLLVGTIGGLVLAYIAYFPIWADVMVRPNPSEPCCTTPADQGFPYEDVAFAGDDGVTLSGWYIPSRNRAAVIVLHGYDANRVQMLDRAVALARYGYGVLLYDLRGHGRSGGELRTMGWYDLDDVAAAVKFLQARPDVDPERLGILGFSVGGQVALRATATMPALKAVVADGPGYVTLADAPPPADFGEQLLYLDSAAAGQVFQWRVGLPPPPGVVATIPAIAPRPLLLISSESGAGRHLIQHYYAVAREPKQLWELPPAGHGQSFVSAPEEYERRIAAFFEALR